MKGTTLNGASHVRARPLLQRLAILLLGVSFVVPVYPAEAQVGSGESTDEGLLDLAAMMLSPDDIEQSGYARGLGTMKAPDVLVRDLALACDPESDEDVEQEISEELEATGFRRQYVAELLLPLEAGDTGSEEFAGAITTYVSEFEDDDGASAGFAYLEDETACFGAGVDMVGDVDIGMEAEVTAVESQESAALDLTFRVDNLVAGVVIENLEGDAPELTSVEDLAQTLLDRIDDVQDLEEPGLGSLVLRLESDAVTAIPTSEPLYGAVPGKRVVDQGTGVGNETYSRLDGEDTVFSGGGPGGERFGNATDAYFLVQPLPDQQLRYTVYLVAFSSDEDASAWFTGFPDLFARESDLVDLAPVEEATAVGDESVTLAYGIDGETVANGVLVATRVDSVVATISIRSEEELSPASVEELALEQVACLEAGTCPDAIPAPESLTGGAVEPDDDNDAGTLTYESPRYGYTITYDPEEWEISAEDNDPDDGYDRVILQHEFGFVMLVGDPDYRRSQLDDCLEDYRLGLEGDEDVSRLREMPGESGEEQDRVWAAYTYDFDTGGDEPFEAAQLIECRQLDDVTLVTVQTSPEEDYEDLADAREELLEGLDEPSPE